MTSSPTPNPSPRKHIDTDLLRVAFYIDGPASGPVALLLHGWPDDAHTWDAVSAALVAKGYRTVRPYLRGFGETRFLKDSTPRTAEPTALASDAVDLLDALGIERAVVVGHDWGARTGYVLAALFPERVERLVACSVAYETGVTPGDKLNYEQQRAYWYQWFFASERGREALSFSARTLCDELWRTWSPSWVFPKEDFETAFRAWTTNPDWVDITLHSYRLRWGNTTETNPRYAELQKTLKTHPLIGVPTVHLHGLEDGAVLASALKDTSLSFTGGYRREMLEGVGHFIPRERPEAVMLAVLNNLFCGENHATLGTQTERFVTHI